MSDIFKLFDGSLSAGGAAALTQQTQDSFSEVAAENDQVWSAASASNLVDLLVDYSDFENFITFNSAESYVTLTADSILNFYPTDGTIDDLQRYSDSLDGYQRYFLANWPSRTGHLRLNPAISSSYVRFDDVGLQDDAMRSSFLSPGTGSISIQGWIDVPVMTGSQDAQVVIQKSRIQTGDSYTVFSSGSSMFFRVISGSVDASVSASLGAMPMFFAAVLDRTTATSSLSIYTASTGTFPTLASSTAALLGPRFDLASGSFYIGSGSVPGKVVRAFTGSIDSINIWSSPRSLSDMTGTFNRRVYAQPDLVASWQFNDATPRTPVRYATIVKDRSGHRLDGRIQSFFSGSLASGSLISDSPDPILWVDDPDVFSYVVAAQRSGSIYDRDNPSIIFNMFPESFLAEDRGGVFRNFALTLARHFDRIKLYITQLPNLRRVNYGDFDQTPDALLQEAARFFGWNFEGNFANADALKFFIGRQVLAGPNGNLTPDIKLSQIKSQIWRRVLLNLPYIYKTKGTAESVNSLLRSYGVGNNFIRLKEFARRQQSSFTLERVVAEKSFYAITISSGSSISYPP